MTLLNTAKSIFLDTLHHLTISEALRTHVHNQGETLHIGGSAYELQNFHRVVVISVGKAAAPMWEALLPELEAVLKRGQAIETIVVGPTMLQKESHKVRFFLGGHPLPDQTSLDAADTVLKLLVSCGDCCLVLFLISGGASAMIEKPVGSHFTVEETAEFYRALIQSGLAITQMNALRKHFSQVKGGRLAVAAQQATQCTLLISDVPRNELHIVGSGPSLPDPSTVEDCRRIIATNLGALNFSGNVLAFFKDPELEETPKADHPAFRNSGWISLLSSDDLCKFAGEIAARLGFHVVVDNRCDDWDYKDAASYLLGRLRGLSQQHSRICLISVGEVTVQLPSARGIGGRNQQFVLECSRLIVDQNMKATVFSGGTDGVDGNSPAAGAVCDETTMTRAVSEGLDIIAGLQQFDSFPIFRALDDAIITGPTGNNVRDLRILLT